MVSSQWLKNEHEIEKKKLNANLPICPFVHLSFDKCFSHSPFYPCEQLQQTHVMYCYIILTSYHGNMPKFHCTQPLFVDTT